MPNYFLAKIDPDTYSINDFVKEKKTLWDGVHNYLACKHISTWEINDIVLIYHSQSDKSIVGFAKVISNPRQNPDDPRYSQVADLELLTVVDKENWVSLKQIKDTGLFGHFDLVKNSRLSVMPCPGDFIIWLARFPDFEGLLNF